MIHSTKDSNIMSLDGTDAYIILVGGWRRTHQSPVNRNEIREVIVEQSVAEFRLARAPIIV